LPSICGVPDVVGITWPVLEEMDDAELGRRLFAPPSIEASPA
jgi:hypothetical protein